MGPKIVAFAGPIGCGKTTAARYLEECFGYERVRFAEPLKRMLKALGCTFSEIDGDRKEDPSPNLCGRTPRYAMQTLGTEWGRRLIHEDLWVTAWQKIVDVDLASGARIVVDDCRFPNEAQSIWARNGVIVRIDRPGVPGQIAAHASESQAFPYDVRLLNDGGGGFFDELNTMITHPPKRLSDA